MVGSLIKPRDGSWDDLTAIFAADLNSPLVISLLFLYCVCFLDVATTSMIIAKGGIELNPLMELFAGSPFLHLLLKWLVVFFIFIAASYCEQKIHISGLFIMGVMILWFLFVVIHNVFVYLTFLYPAF
ncbi:MAG: DUF5658 family protein [Methanoregula sp.]|jgi:hypothetical protein|uniref:DUF5658 family protein n=1 Tax=Methanoregula sp. TaxID=2052170 RepID=UPI003BB12326